MMRRGGLADGGCLLTYIFNWDTTLSLKYMMKLYVNSYFIRMKTLIIYFGQKYCLENM